MRSWLKGQAVLIALFVSVIAIVVPGEVTVSYTSPTPVSIKAVSHDTVLLPVAFRGVDRLYASRPTRSDSSASPPDKPSATSLLAYGYDSNYGLFFAGICESNIIFRRAFQQACLLLDVPPPAYTIS